MNATDDMAVPAAGCCGNDTIRGCTVDCVRPEGTNFTFALKTVLLSLSLYVSTSCLSVYIRQRLIRYGHEGNRSDDDGILAAGTAIIIIRLFIILIWTLARTYIQHGRWRHEYASENWDRYMEQGHFWMV